MAAPGEPGTSLIGNRRAREDVERSRAQIGAAKIVPELSHREDEVVCLGGLRGLVLEHEGLARPGERGRKVVIRDLTLGRRPEKSAWHTFGHICGHPCVNGPLGKGNRHDHSLTQKHSARSLGLASLRRVASRGLRDPRNEGRLRRRRLPHIEARIVISLVAQRRAGESSPTTLALVCRWSVMQPAYSNSAGSRGRSPRSSVIRAPG